MADREPARLFSTSGIETKVQARQRATEALMAAMTAAPSLGLSLLKSLGVRADSKTQLESFVGARLGGSRGPRADGLVVASKGRSEVAIAFVVRVGEEKLPATAVKKLSSEGEDVGIAAVVTIGGDPNGVDLGRRRSGVPVAHWPWASLMSALVEQKVRDPEQARIIGDLVAFLQHPDIAAGAGAADMGPNWAAVLKTARTSRLSVRDKGVADVCRRWDQVARHVAASFGTEIGRDVQLQLSRNEARDADARLDALIRRAADSGQLEAVFDIPDAAGDLAVVADLPGRRLVSVVSVEPPEGLGERATVGWLLDGLTGAPADTVIEAWPTRGDEPLAAARLDDLDADMGLLSSNRRVGSYRILRAAEMGTARSSNGRSAGFVDTVLEIVADTWGEILGPLSGESRRSNRRTSSSTTRRMSTSSTGNRRTSSSSSSSRTRRRTSARKTASSSSSGSRKTSTTRTTSSSSSSRRGSSNKKRKSASDLAAELRRERR